MGEHTVTKLAGGGGFFEGPRWHDGRWWVSDFYRHAVLTYDTDGHEEPVLTVDGQPSGLGWLPDGSLLVVSMLDRRVLRLDADGVVHEHADIGEHCGSLANDMVVDAAGRAWVGNFGFDLMAGDDPGPTNLVRVDPDGTVAVAADGLMFPNGSVVTPDGCCLDAEGHIWCADALGSGCVRVAERGAIVDRVPPPDGLPVYACMLGGDDGRTLLLCAAPDHHARRRSAAQEAALYTTRVDVPHAGLP